jgi:DNA-binding transcriptional regulator PaaX
MCQKSLTNVYFDFFIVEPNKVSNEELITVAEEMGVNHSVLQKGLTLMAEA